jgi:hypothetical protein
MFPHNGFEPWQDMWMMIWAWKLHVPVRVFHNKCYSRVQYEHAKKQNRVKGRCLQTIKMYQERLFPIITAEKYNWELGFFATGCSYIQHRGNQHYLVWTEREKFEFSLHHILTYVSQVPEFMQMFVVRNVRSCLQENAKYGLQIMIEQASKLLPPSIHKLFHTICHNFDIMEFSKQK